ncbi:asparagine synthase-related protein [Phenylobacterium sp. 58.2.17]|uniref:asparagine synthase-related protein n=1 Tax=Phenylobacterium sp. 58.2.17 TaxID=2969306 RepID=UPI002263F69D|nr:asparagine synthase-related protein [Phenylobacterium sp. 58.2.17]MCX7587286.1 asparagine synthase-related protein [Phenylobacterium sp. 58.2.17]
MSGYVVLTWPSDDAEARNRLAALLPPVVLAEGWRWAIKDDNWWVLTTAHQPPAILQIPDVSGLIIGDLFTRQFAAATPAMLRGRLSVERACPERQCRNLLADFWGRYVAVLPQDAGPRPAIFRDPSGALECLTWETGGVTVVASHLPDWLLDHLTPRLAVDWSRVGAFLTNSANIGGPLALSGIEAVPAGALYADGQVKPLWRPGDIARRPAPSLEQAQDGLREVVDGCVAALASPPGSIIAEVSGGFDSAVVAATLARLPNAGVVQWVNYHAPDRRGDERRYARALADHCRFTLSEAIKPEAGLIAAGLQAISGGPRPALDGLDVPRDRDIAARCETLGARAIFTGQGGDMVFFQRATPLVLADDLRRRGLRALSPTALRNMSIWTGRSAWSALHSAVHGSRRGTTAVDHPWLADLEGLPPAKRLQIETLAECQMMSGDSLRARQATMIHPLLAQPVMEHCLTIPVMDLTGGRRDRALARRAFADRLPRLITERRAKGELSAYYGRMVTASLDFLRPQLLEGRLAAHGLIDRNRLDDVLTPESLIWRGDYAGILVTALVESWAASWERRIAAGFKAP